MDEVDTFSTIEKQIKMLDLILYFHQRAEQAIRRGVIAASLHQLEVVNTLIRMKTQVTNLDLRPLDDLHQQINREISELEQQYV